MSGLFDSRTAGRGLNFGKSRRVTPDKLRAWREHNRQRAAIAAESPGPAEASPELPNPAALPEAAGVAAGSNDGAALPLGRREGGSVIAGTSPTGTGD